MTRDALAAVVAIRDAWRDNVGRYAPTDAPYDAEHARRVARWYIENVETCDRPTRKALRAWATLADVVHAQYAELADVLNLGVVDVDPYASAADMRADVERGRLLVLATDPGSHPVWSDETNDRFRAVHDALGHAATGTGFDRYGEETAYRSHAETMPSEVALAALACETRGQNAALVWGPDVDGRRPGTFARQGCVKAPTWVWAPNVT